MRNGLDAEVKVSRPEGGICPDAVTRARAPVLGRHETTIPPIHPCHGSRDPGPRGRAVLLRHGGPDDHRCPGQERDHRRQGHQEQVRHRQGPQEEVGGEEAHQEERDHVLAGEGRLAERHGPPRSARSPASTSGTARSRPPTSRRTPSRCWGVARAASRSSTATSPAVLPLQTTHRLRDLPRGQGRDQRQRLLGRSSPTWSLRRSVATGRAASPRKGSFPVNVIGADSVQLQLTCLSAG